MLIEELEPNRSILLIHKIKKYFYQSKYFENTKKKFFKKQTKFIFQNNFLHNLTFYYEYLVNKLTNKEKLKNSQKIKNFSNFSKIYKKNISFLRLSKLNSTYHSLGFSINKILQLYEAYITKSPTEIYSFSQ
jgi:uncharacterized protein (UPF0305 family)